MGLFTPYLSNDRNKAMPAVKKLTDEKKLFQAAMDSPIADVQEIAISKITNQDLLYDIAKSTSCKKSDKATERLDQDHLKKYVDENGASADVVALISDQDFLYRMISTSNEVKIRAAAIKNLDDANININLLKELALTAAFDKYDIPFDAYAAIDKIKDEAVLFDIAMNANADAVCSVAADHLNDETHLTEYLLNTKYEFGFNNNAPRIKNPDNRARIIKDAKIRNPKSLNLLYTKAELLDRCLKNKAPKLVEDVYESTWDTNKLNQLCVLCNNEELKEKIELRLKTAEQFDLLKAKAYSFEINDDMNAYINALNKELELYRTVKNTIKAQGRSISFDAIYGLYGEDLNRAIMNRCGLSITYFLGGPVLGGFALIGPKIKLSDCADKSIWAVVAALQLADTSYVTERLYSDITKEDAAKLLYDIEKLWFDKIS